MSQLIIHGIKPNNIEKKNIYQLNISFKLT